MEPTFKVNPHVVNPVFYNPSGKSECTIYPHSRHVKSVKLEEISDYEMANVKFITLSPNPFP
jgi:hypothetical protein